ncbi:MAG: hypothetical protein COA47_14450 [Robiginitomaculum sp.]|nr:MAG: hypothetical protein COA47_14450 [Robiginitomaculum sp.]
MILSDKVLALKTKLFLILSLPLALLGGYALFLITDGKSFKKKLVGYFALPVCLFTIFYIVAI